MFGSLIDVTRADLYLFVGSILFSIILYDYSRVVAGYERLTRLAFLMLRKFSDQSRVLATLLTLMRALFENISQNQFPAFNRPFKNLFFHNRSVDSWYAENYSL